MPSNSAFKSPFSPSFSSEALIEEIKDLQSLQELSAPFINVFYFEFTFIVIPLLEDWSWEDEISM